MYIFLLFNNVKTEASTVQSIVTVHQHPDFQHRLWKLFVKKMQFSSCFTRARNI